MNKKLTLIVVIAIAFVAGFYLFDYFKKTAASTVRATYLCREGKTIDVVFHNSEPKLGEPGEPPIPTGSVNIVLSDGRKMKLGQTISADGVRYANKDESFVFWNRGSGALVLEDNVEKSYIGCVELAKDPGGLSNAFSDEWMGISIRYPKDYFLHDSYKYQALGPGKDIYGVQFTIPAYLAAGKNLSDYDTGVSVEIIPAVENCTYELFLNHAETSQIVTDNDTEYSYASVMEGAVGNRYEEMVWAVVGTNPCVAVRYLIHSTNIDNYDPGVVTEFDRTALLQEFDKIRRSLIINR
jgi:membrane-bound inhibitor of C-type lysozyme